MRKKPVSKDPRPGLTIENVMERLALTNRSSIHYLTRLGRVKLKEVEGVSLTGTPGTGKGARWDEESVEREWQRRLDTAIAQANTLLRSNPKHSIAHEERVSLLRDG